MNAPPPVWPPPVAAPPPKKSSNGCVIAVVVVGALAVLGGLVIAGITYYVASSDEGKKIVSAVVDGAQMIQEAQSAPGTAELRKLGCSEAMVMDMERLANIVDQFDDGGLPTGQVSVMVTCQVGVFGGKGPSCDEVAATYLTAAPAPSKPFAVTVAQQPGSQFACSHLYAPDGTSLADLKQAGGTE
jgi:hypothetical protein